MIVLAALAAGIWFLSRDNNPTTPPASAPGKPTRRKFVRRFKTGQMTLVIGASQSGKTYYVLSQIRKATRLLIWDVEEQYADEPGMTVARSLGELATMLEGCPREFRIAYVPNDVAEFPGWCKWAWFALESGLHHQDATGYPLPTYLVAEEISDVTNPGKAPPEWGKIIRRGLKRNMWLYSVTQSPSESDKTTVKNCSEVHVCGVQSDEEAEYLGRKLGINAGYIASLVREEKQFMHVNLVTKKVTAGGKTPPAFISELINQPINTAYKPPRRERYKGKAKAPETPAAQDP